ncbi:MAG: c-type cytochrome [Candidatus Acidiferrales bacterium]
MAGNRRFLRRLVAFGPRLSTALLFAFAALSLQPYVPASAAQDTKNPLADNLKAIQEGASQFRADCALCHGLHATGGSRGPDLTRGVWNHGGSDAEIFRTITEGVPGTLMPANILSEAETWEIIAYLRTLAPKQPEAVPGDLKAGEKIFRGDGNCSLCHMVAGQGGRLGPDLSRVGAARSPKYLMEKLRNPNSSVAVGLMEPGKEWPLEYGAVTVITRGGEKITGVIRNEDAYSIQLMDISENLHTYMKAELLEVKHLDASVMPAYTEDMLDKAQLRDMVAYLTSLRGSAGGEPGK